MRPEKWMVLECSKTGDQSRKIGVRGSLVGVLVEVLGVIVRSRVVEVLGVRIGVLVVRVNVLGIVVVVLEILVIVVVGVRDVRELVIVRSVIDAILEDGSLMYRREGCKSLGVRSTLSPKVNTGGILKTVDEPSDDESLVYALLGSMGIGDQPLLSWTNIRDELGNRGSLSSCSDEVVVRMKLGKGVLTGAVTNPGPHIIQSLGAGSGVEMDPATAGFTNELGSHELDADSRSQVRGEVGDVVLDI